MELTEGLVDRLQRLQKKYDAMGQNLESYLDGLLYADYLTYWDYVQLDTLLSLQKPRTPVPDEEIFIIYHQITELYFKLIIKAIRQLATTEALTATLFKRQLARVNDYFENLVHSFDIMVEGMDKDEFLQFRMSLLPASGFQSAQYRLIELMSAPVHALTHPSLRESLAPNAPLSELLPCLYWRSGATELATGKKTLTLQQFEQKYGTLFEQTAHEFEQHNLAALFQSLPDTDKADPELRELLRQHDLNANVRWNLMHYKSAVRYLDRKPQEIAATGGTNWQKYLPPRFQRIIFFPFLFSEEEITNWGTNQ